MISQEFIKKIEDEVNKHLVFDGEFEAFTPWWGGNECGYTIYPEPHYPEPKEIIGKTKWTIRTLCGSVPKELGASEEMASKVKVSVSVTKQGEKYFEIDKESYREKINIKILERMRENGYKLLFPGYNPKKTINLREEYSDEFYKLLAIPRFYLRSMGRESIQEIYKLQPMKPGFRIRIRVFSKDKDVAKLFVNAMIITLKYLGIGSAANRGFGRFKLVNVNHTIEGIEKDIDITKEVPIKCKNEGGSFPRFPKPEEIKVIKPVYACIYGRRYEAKSIEGVLAAIGIATLKSTWKAHCRNLMGSGADYHTWVLGLPRKVNNKGYITDQELRRQSYIVISPTEDLGVMLLPFYAEDYTTIYHRNHGKKEVTKIERRRPNCTSEKASQSVKDHIDLALEWLKMILSGKC